MTKGTNQKQLPALAIGSIDGFRIFLGILREIFATITGFFAALGLLGFGGGDDS